MFSAVAVGLQLERRLESSERFMFPIARPLLLRSWFSRFLLGSGNLQFKTQSDAATGPGKSLLKWRLLLSRPDLLYQVTWVGIESNYQQLCFLFLFVCYLKGFPSQKKWLSGGFRNITCLTASHLSLSLSHTHTHTHPMAMTGWYGCKRPTALLSVVFFVPQFKHTGLTKATLWLSSLHCLAHFPLPHSASLTLLPLRACPQKVTCTRILISASASRNPDLCHFPFGHMAA